MTLNKRFFLALIFFCLIALVFTTFETGAIRSVFARTDSSQSSAGKQFAYEGRNGGRKNAKDRPGLLEHLSSVESQLRASSAQSYVKAAMPFGLAPPLSLVVNRTDDITPRGTGSTCITAASSDCTLREAIIKANANSGSTITFAASTNGVPITLALVNAGGVNEDASLTGDLDVNASVTIQGNGAANTIIQAGTTNSNGIDKVFGLNPICTSSVNVSIDSVTIRNGRNTQPFGSPDFSHTGGGLDFCAPSGSASLSITNSNITDNTDVNAYGGGLDIDSSAGWNGTVTLTNDLFQNNKTLSTVTLSVGGAINSRGSAQTININNCRFISNSTASQVGNGAGINIRQINGGSVNIHNSVFDGNIAGGNGGAIGVDNTDDNNGATPIQTVTIDQGTVIKNNVSGGVSGGSSGGGGLYINGNVVGTTTVTNSTFLNNSEGSSAGTKLGGGGILVDAGSLTITFSRIVNNKNNTGSLGGSGIFKSGTDAGTVNATDNWWGCSDGPVAAPCDTAVHGTGGLGTLSFTPFLRLHTTANPGTIALGGTSSLLTRIQDSAGNDQAVGNLNQFLGPVAAAGTPLPVTWGATTNTITPINATLVSSAGFAQASATYNGTAKAHADPASAKVDNDFTTGSHTDVAPVTVLAPPTVSKLFGSAVVPINGVTTLSITITNPNTGDPLNGLAVSDTFPSGLVVDSTPGLVNTCGGTVTAVAGSGSVSLSGGTVAANLSCSVTVNVKGTTDGTKTNTTGNVTATDVGGLTGNTGSASILVANPPSIVKAFGGSTVSLNGNTSLTFSLSNSNASTALSGIAFTDSLPAGLLVATPSGLTSTCNGTATAVNGSTSASLSGASLAAGATCSISLNVNGTTVGVKNNSVTVTSTTTGALNSTSNASVTVVAPPTISKTFGAPSIPLNTSTSLSFTINNPSTTVGLTGVGFTDNLPSGLVVSTPNGVSGSCGSGTITAVAGSTSVSLSGGTIAASGNCTFAVNVDGTSAGNKNNTTTAVASTEGGTGLTASASLNVEAPPTFSKSFGAATVPLNGTTPLIFTITNPAGNPVSLTGVNFTDSLPAGLVVATPNGLSTNGNCGSPSVTATAGTSSVSFNSGVILTNTSCSVTVHVTGTTAGLKSNTTGAIGSTSGGTGLTASASLTVVAPPTVSKAFNPTTIAVNGSTQLTLTLSNPNASTTLTGVNFSDNMTGGLQVASTPGIASTCTGTWNASAGDTTLNFGGGTMSPNSTCTLNVNITSISTGTKTNTTNAPQSNEGGFGVASNTASLNVIASTAAFTINNASLTKPATGTGTMLFTVSLAQPATATTTVHYSTADGTAIAGTDYVAVPDTLLTFNTGDQLKTIPVTINGGVAASDKTFTVTLSNPSAGASITTATGTGTIKAQRTPSIALISELRSSGPAGAGDDFVEIYNNADTPLTVEATDASAGWGVVASTSGCGNPQVIGVIPNGTVIPARGHYLLGGSGYSLGGVNGYPAGTTGSGKADANLTLTTDIDNDANVGLFSTASLGALSSANRLDAVGFGANTGGNCDLLREGNTLLIANGSTSQYSFVRKETTGLSQDTDDNATDFVLVSTTPFTAVGSNLTPVLGAPGPENLLSPINMNGLTPGVIDPNVAATLAPNRVRDTTPYTDTLSGTSPGPGPGPYTLGTLVVRRSYTNNTGAPVTRLRFRFIDVTTDPEPVGTADLRGVTSPASQSVATSVGTVTVIGTALEGVSTPAPSQPFGGGINSTMTVPLATPLPNGSSISVQWMLGVKQGGTFRFFVLIEGL